MSNGLLVCDSIAQVEKHANKYNIRSNKSRVQRGTPAPSGSYNGPSISEPETCVYVLCWQVEVSVPVPEEASGRDRVVRESAMTFSLKLIRLLVSSTYEVRS